MNIVRQLLICAALIFSASANDLVTATGGISPDKKWAVAVVPQKKGEFIDEADGSVYLVENSSKKIIQKLDDVDSTGGTWGKTTENVDCKWSPDGRFVGINMRTGRLMHSCILYQIQAHKATLVKLPDVSTNKKSKIYEALQYTANPGEVITAWKSPTTFTVEEYGLRPKHDDIDLSEYGFKDFDGLIEKVFRLDGSHWILEDLRVPKDENKDGSKR